MTRSRDGGVASMRETLEIYEPVPRASSFRSFFPGRRASARGARVFFCFFSVQLSMVLSWSRAGVCWVFFFCAPSDRGGAAAAASMSVIRLGLEFSRMAAVRRRRCGGGMAVRGWVFGLEGSWSYSRVCVFFLIVLKCNYSLCGVWRLRHCSSIEFLIMEGCN